MILHICLLPDSLHAFKCPDSLLVSIELNFCWTVCNDVRSAAETEIQFFWYDDDTVGSSVRRCCLWLLRPAVTRRHSRSTSALSSAECYSGDQWALSAGRSLSQPDATTKFNICLYLRNTWLSYLADWALLLSEASPCMERLGWETTSIQSAAVQIPEVKVKDKNVWRNRKRCTEAVTLVSLP